MFFKKKINNEILIGEALNVVESITKAKSLYKNLVGRSHPDRHPTNIEVSTELMSLINQNKNNYRELLKLEKRVINELE